MASSVIEAFEAPNDDRAESIIASDNDGQVNNQSIKAI